MLKKAEKYCKTVINIRQTEVALVVVMIPMLCGWYNTNFASLPMQGVVRVYPDSWGSSQGPGKDERTAWGQGGF